MPVKTLEVRTENLEAFTGLQPLLTKKEVAQAKKVNFHFVGSNNLLVQKDDAPLRVRLASKASAFNSYCEDLDRILKVGEASGHIIQSSREIAGRPHSGSCASGLDAVGVARDMLSLVRVIPALCKLGNYKPDNTKARFFDILIDICVLAARCLNPVKWLDKMKAIDIGKHAETIGKAITACWAAVTTLCFVSALVKYMTVKPKEMVDEMANLICSFFDMLSMPWDVFNLFSYHPVVSLVGGGLMGLSGTVWLVAQLTGHRVTVPAEESALYITA